MKCYCVTVLDMDLAVAEEEGCYVIGMDSVAKYLKT